MKDNGKVALLIFASVFYGATLLITKIVYLLLGLGSRSVGWFDYFQLLIHYFYKPAIINKLAIVSMIVFGLLALIAVLGWRARTKPKLHGESSVATTKDIKKMGLYSHDGLILGEQGGRLLRAPGVTPSILTAPTRSGKGVSIIIPNLIAHKGSVIAYDPKLELYRSVAAHRQKAGQGVYLWAPGMPFTHRWNPFDMFEVSDPDLFDSVLMIANILCPTPPDVKDPMWTQNARKFFLGAVFAMYDTGEYVTLPAIRAWIDRYQMGNRKDEEDDESEQEENDHSNYETLGNFLERSHELLGDVATSNLTFIAALPKLTADGVKGQIVSSLAIFQSPSVAYAFSDSDFDLRNIRRDPMSIFVGSTKRTLSTGRDVYSLFFQMATMILTENLPRKDETHQVLMCLDEFTGLGPMDVIKRAVSDIAGYMVRLFIIVQNFAQMKHSKMYGDAGLTEFLGNMEFETYYRPKMLADAKDLSAAMGDNTVKSISKSSPTFLRGFGNRGSHSQNTSETKRALMLPQELMRMSDDEVLILKPGQPPVIAKKLMYYNDRRFKGMFYDIENPSKTPNMLSPNVPLVAGFEAKFGDTTNNQYWEEGLNESEGPIIDDFVNDSTDQPRLPHGGPVLKKAVGEKIVVKPNKIVFPEVDMVKQESSMPEVTERTLTKKQRDAYVDEFFAKHVDVEADLMQQAMADNLGSQAISLGDPESTVTEE